MFAKYYKPIQYNTIGLQCNTIFGPKFNCLRKFDDILKRCRVFVRVVNIQTFINVPLFRICTRHSTQWHTKTSAFVSYIHCQFAWSFHINWKCFKIAIKLSEIILVFWILIKGRWLLLPVNGSIICHKCTTVDRLRQAGTRYYVALTDWLHATFTLLI